MKKYSFLILGVVFGALSGYLYWSYFGCTSGCAITSSPLNSSIYGAVMGGFMVQSFVKKEAKS